MPYISLLLTYNRSREREIEIQGTRQIIEWQSRQRSEFGESAESFIRAIRSDARFVGATYSLVEQSSLKVKGPGLWLRLCSLNSLSIVHDQTIAVRTKKPLRFNSLGRLGYFGRFETCREYLAAEACRTENTSTAPERTRSTSIQ